MRDPRLQVFAKNIINYSVNLQPGENVLIDFIGIKDPELLKCFLEEARKAGGNSFVDIRDPAVNRSIMINGTEENFRRMAEIELFRMSKMDAYIAVRGGENVSETADVPKRQMKLYTTHFLRPITDYRVDNTKWCVMRYPAPSMAQQANTSTEAFENFYFDVCNVNYARMGNAMDSLVQLMLKTDKVRIVSPGTDLSFSIKGIPAIKCCGRRNIPDGEVYTAPVRDSVNGVLSYNTPTVYQGSSFDNVVLRFENGKIIKATSSDTKRMNEILDTDEGARYIGEFAIGVNPYILHPMKDTLFDEKIAGSFHFTPGKAYEIANNGNNSAIHWDMVLIQRPEYGGGEIYFDNVLIRKDGLFVIPELESLNPENLKN